MPPQNQVIVFASSRAAQFSPEYPAMGHWAFTAALLEGVGMLWRADSYEVGRVTYKVTSEKADLIHQNFSSQGLGSSEAISGKPFRSI
jgi:hypothetical protein